MISKPEPASPVQPCTHRHQPPSLAWIRRDMRHSRSRRATPILASPFGAPRLLLAVQAGAIALALMDTAAQAAAGPAPRPAGSSLEQYLGRWNYDQPDRDGMRNVAVIQCPANNTSCAGRHSGQSWDRIEGYLQEVRLVRVREGAPGERAGAFTVLKQMRMRTRNTTTRRGSPTAPLADPEPGAVPALRNRDQSPAFTRPGDNLAPVR